MNVRLVLATLPKAVLVPAAAAQDSAKGSFVYVVKEDSTAELRPVKLGQRQGEMVVVEQGRAYLGQEVVITVTSVLQTPAGRMIFGRIDRPLPAAAVASTAAAEKPRGERYG